LYHIYRHGVDDHIMTLLKKQGAISKLECLSLHPKGKAMFVETYVICSALFIFWLSGMTVLLVCPPGDVIFDQLACP
jgi:hypothetical protein